MFSNRSEYAIRALAELAKTDNLMRSEEIAKNQNLPPKFLPHILSDLARAGLIRTSRGYGGGIVLNGRPDQITFKAIVEAVQGPIVTYECLVGVPQCGIAENCLLKTIWQKFQDTVDDILESTTLQDLVTSKKKEENDGYEG
jgi:Rrf2 family protein